MHGICYVYSVPWRLSILVSPRMTHNQCTWSVGHRGNDVTLLVSVWYQWPWNLVKVELELYLNCKLRFPCAPSRLQQILSTSVSVSIKAEYWVSWLRKQPLNESFSASNHWLKIHHTIEKCISAVSVWPIGSCPLDSFPTKSVIVAWRHSGVNVDIDVRYHGTVAREWLLPWTQCVHQLWQAFHDPQGCQPHRGVGMPALSDDLHHILQGLTQQENESS